VRTRTLVVSGLLAALVLAGVASFYASSHPDGLEYVAEQTGFLDSADDSAAADGPMADYAVTGVDSPRLAGGLAGVVGVLVTLGLAGGVAYAVRRRQPDDTEQPTSERV
jgi:cobalt/nickel transport protein